MTVVKISQWNADGTPAMPNEEPETGLRAVNVGDFLSMPLPARGQVLAPFLPEQGLSMVYAPRGLGKTWVSLTCAWAIASGQAALGRWQAPRPRRVLFIDGEMPAAVLRDRLAGIVAGCNGEPPEADFFRILTPDLQPDAMPNLATRAGQDAVEPLLDGVECVVLDNLATLAREGRENDAESWLPVQAWLLSLRRRGLSVLLVHHAGKGGQQRGTSAREDVLDAVVALRRPSDYEPEQGARFEVHYEKARGACGAEVAPFEARLVLDGGVASWGTQDLDDAELEQVRKLLSEGLSVRDIAEETGLSKSRVGRLKKRVEGGGL